MSSSQEDNGCQSTNLNRLFSQVQLPLEIPTQNEDGQLQLAVLPSKTFNDPIHGLIDVEFMLVKLIDTPYVQRLRFLNQLGAGSYVFPGAAHNRFQHSLGTMHLCGQMAEALRQNDLTGTIAAQLTDKVILLIKAAGLFHDTGHGPLSHCFDGLFIPYLIRTTEDQELKIALEGWHHEDTSEHMVTAAIQSTGLTDPALYQDYITEDEIKYIQQLINPPDDITQRVFPHLGFTYDIVSNSRCSVDVDKFDYLERDSFHAGLRSAFRAEQLIKNCRAINGQIAFNKKIAFEVYQLFHARYSLFKQVYSHRKVKAVEFMITDAMMLADPVLQIGRKVLDLNEYVKLNDSIVQIIEFFPLETIQNEQHRADMEKAQHILNRLRWRDLYKYCAESLLAHNSNPAAVKAIKEQLVFDILKTDFPNTQLTVNDIVLQKMTLNYALKDKNPVDDVTFYNNLYDTVAHPIPREKVSLLIPQTFSEQYIRIFIKINDPEEKRRAAAALDKCLRTHLDSKSGLHSLDQKDIEHSADGVLHNNNSSTTSSDGGSRLQGYSSQIYMSQSNNGGGAPLARLGVTNANSSMLHRTATHGPSSSSTFSQPMVNNHSPQRSTLPPAPHDKPAAPVRLSKPTTISESLTTPQKRTRNQTAISTPLLSEIREERDFESDNDDDITFMMDRSQSVMMSSQTSTRSTKDKVKVTGSVTSNTNKKQKPNSIGPAEGQKTLKSYFGDKRKGVQK